MPAARYANVQAICHYSKGLLSWGGDRLVQVKENGEELVSFNYDDDNIRHQWSGRL